LAEYFLQKTGKTIAPAALALLKKHTWPGNVRELENVIERAAVMARGQTILPEDLPADVREPKAPAVAPEDVNAVVDAAVRALFVVARQDPKLKILPAAERELIIRALAETGGNQVQSAKLLGITRATLRKRIAKFGILRRLELQ
jgi:DNA-binding NtrC family response regulator